MTSEIKVDTISEQTSANGVTIDGLTIKDGNIQGSPALVGTTPSFTIGDGGAEDTKIVFDGNALDYYIGLDDSADNLIIGSGSTVGSNSLITIDSDGDFTLDSAGEIHLDADGGIIRFKDAGTAIGTFENVSSDFIIKSSVSDKDLIFKGNDGGSAVTALTLDMSDAGTATFNHDIVLADDNIAKFGDSGELVIYHHNNGSSYIQETGGGDLQLLASNFKVMNAAGTENKIAATTDGAVDLYYNNVKKFLTSSTGINLPVDGDSIKFGANSEVILTHVHNTGLEISSTSAGDLLTLKSTEAGAEAGPNLVLFRDSASPANNDVIGRMRFEGDDNEGNKTVYAQLTSQIIDKGSSGGEDSSFQMEVFNNGALRDIMSVKGATNGLAEVVFNESSQDVNFRIESDGNANMLFVDGGNDKVGIGTSSPAAALEVFSGSTPQIQFGTASATADRNAGMSLYCTASATAGSRKVELFLDADGNNADGTDWLKIKKTGNSGDALIQQASTSSLILKTAGTLIFETDNTERSRILSDGTLLVGKAGSGIASAGCELATDKLSSTVSAATVQYINRLSNDGTLVQYHQAGTEEGSISVSGSAVSYNGFTGGHWSRLSDNSKPTILRGTIMDSIDEMCDWYQAVADVQEVLWTADDPETQDVLWTADDELPVGVQIGDVNEKATQIIGEVKQEAYTVKEPITLGDKSVGDAITFTSNTKIGDGKEHTGTIVKEDDVKHTKSKVSDTADSKKVYGVFSNWDDADDGLDGDVNDMNIAQVGTFIIRVHKDVTVEAGDLLVSNGDGTAKVQDDDIIRSKTVAKVNSNIKVETYSDGSYTVPCTLHC